MSRRVLFTGSRDWTDAALIYAAVDALPLDAVIIVGDCPTGVDAFALERAKARGLTVDGGEPYKADWTRFGNAAGPLRNSRMVDEGRPTEAEAYPLPGSRGTWDCVRKCTRAGVPVKVSQAMRLNHARTQD